MEFFFGLLATSLYEVTFLCISSEKSQNIFLSLYGFLLSVFSSPNRAFYNIYYFCSSPVLIPLGLPVAFWMQLRGGPCGPASYSPSLQLLPTSICGLMRLPLPSHLVLAVSSYSRGDTMWAAPSSPSLYSNA